MADWSRIATRFRVPLGFLFAAGYLYLAHPWWFSLCAGSGFIVMGLVVRALASGHIRKNAQLAMTGPYAFSRNPLYLGSILIAIGFVVASRNWWIALATLAMFIFIYLPVVRAEEKFLGSTFPDYAEYSAHVPRFGPRLTPYRASSEVTGVFSKELYMKHREYNAILGSALMLAALILKITWYKH